MTEEAQQAEQVSGERLPSVTVGLFGPRRLVKTMSEVGQEVVERSVHGVRFLTGGYDDLSEAEERYLRLRDRIDAAVFPGPWAFDLATTGHWLTVPSTHLPLTGAALYAALLRASLTIKDVDLTRVSIDSLSLADVSEAYSEIGLDTAQVYDVPYEGPESVAGFAAFHREKWERQHTTVALTTILSVERELRADGVPVLRIAPTRSSVRDALETAVLLGQGTRMGAHQLAMIAVQVIPSGAESGDYWQQELALSTHQKLLSEARQVGASVTRRSDTLFLVTTTYGALLRLTEQFAVAPFLGALTAQLGVPVAVGAGTGQTARAAEANALMAVEDSVAAGGKVAVYLDGSSDRVDLEPGPATTDSAPVDGTSPIDQRVLEIVTSIASAMSPAPGRQVVVDVESVAAIMQVTQRTGRRMLKELVEAGLAWPLPPARSTAGGRPRQQFRLLTEKLD
ncbi:transcriptional regulator [Kribbella sindirgiensis]|uniref:Transcriptional regulator n=1 Tax=Kribbella sindirgiensis TaxID=1124744 RepID=A0A4V2M3K1_9ACTN|nr:transcriptional regulator [Kribbella sindirgiensis]TCC32342.1 transcriptional regulator [Kribbella sindirgiensis]